MTAEPAPAVVNTRMIAAAFAVLGGLVAFYLFLTEIGSATLVCPTTGCEVVQKSVYSRFLGIPVAAFGLAGFAALVAVAVTGLYRDRVLGVPVQAALVWLAAIGLLAYVPLTYLELFVIHAVCFWCVTSSLMMVGVLVSALAGRRAAH